jgi:hypothetical protein
MSGKLGLGLPDGGAIREWGLIKEISAACRLGSQSFDYYMKLQFRYEANTPCPQEQ